MLHPASSEICLWSGFSDVDNAANLASMGVIRLARQNLVVFGRLGLDQGAPGTPIAVPEFYWTGPTKVLPSLSVR